MCLVSNWPKPKWSWHKQTCFKVVRRIGYRYYTPVVGTEITEKLKGFKFKAKGDHSFIRKDTTYDEYVYGKGFIHANTNPYITLASYFPENPSEYELWECEIPRFTKYIIGKDSDICATKIKFINKVW